ncbi:MAG: hypothetical protein ACD_77C00107G0002 [uncultured bacterium]|nr:MAG: hypothetical protein ACD_77C00107G0002 [uncultured bacterium]
MRNMRCLMAVSACLFLSLFFTLSLSAQTAVTSSKEGLQILEIDTAPFVDEPEKLYIHTDRETYLQGDKIWLKGYLANSSYVSKAPLSTYIYAELYRDTLISRIKIKMSGNGYAGVIQLPDKMDPGTYILRGYTQNMRNYSPEFMFTKRIEILNLSQFLGEPSISASLGKPASPKSENKTVIDQTSVPQDIDIQFMPESGRYIAGRPSKVAFKAIGTDGKAADVNLHLFNSAGSLLGEYISKHKGMGLFTLLSVESGGYYALVSDVKGFTKRVNLPDVQLSGAAISVNRIKDRITVVAQISAEMIGNCKLIIKNGSEEFYTKTLEKEEYHETALSGSMPYGVNSIQIQTPNGEIVSERLIFINRVFRPVIKIESNKPLFGKREAVDLTFSVTDTLGNPVQGEFSISVTDSILAPSIPNRENIVSYMELSGELRGQIEEPGFYFENPTSETERYLDLLMMTQGWRYHSKSIKKYKREYFQEISGSVAGLFRKEAKNTTLMVFAPSIQLQQAFYLEKKSTFTLEGLSFPDSTKFLFGVAGRQGGQLYGISIKAEDFPPIAFAKNYKIPQIKKSIIESAVKEQRSISTGEEMRMLKEIVVVAPVKEIFKPKYNPSPFLHTFRKEDIREREQLADYDNMMLQDYIISTFPGLYAESDSEGNRRIVTPRAVTLNGPGEPHVYVDGLKWNSTAMLDQYGMTVMDIENVAYLRGTSGAAFNTINGVILITSRKGGQSYKSAATNVARVIPMGYQKTVEFYSPKYESYKEITSPVKDLRTTVYWNPGVKTNTSGVATVTFYTGDRDAGMNIRVEGLTIWGEAVVKNGIIKRGEIR